MLDIEFGLATCKAKPVCSAISLGPEINLLKVSGWTKGIFVVAGYNCQTY